MRKRLVFSISILLHFSMLVGQHDKYELNVVVCDHENNGVPTASIVDTTSGKGVITDLAGQFTWAFSSFPLVLKISHVSYLDEYIIIDNYVDYQKNYENKLVFRNLQLKEISIEEVMVTGNRFQIMENEPYAIIDYLIDGEKVIALAFRNGNQYRREIIVGNYNNLKHRKSLKHAEALIENFSNEKYVKTKDSLYTLSCRDSSILLNSFCSVEFYNNEIDPIKAVFPDGFIALAQSENIQYQEYCFYQKQKPNKVVFYQLGNISKENHLEAINTRIRDLVISEYNRSWISSGELRKMHGEMAKLRVTINSEYKPVQSSLIPFRDSFLLFDFLKEKVNCFDQHASLLRVYNLDVDLNKEFTGRLHFDKATNRCFLEYQRIQTTYLIEINPATGQTIKRIDIKGHKHIEKLKISNGRVYYLYQPDFGNAMKQLFSYAI